MTNGELLRQPLDAFKLGVKEAIEVVNVDEEYLSVYGKQLDKLIGGDSLKPKATEDAKKILLGLKSTAKSKSLRPKYSAMVTQLMVVLVSHFESAVSELFIVAFLLALKGGKLSPGKSEEKLRNWTFKDIYEFREMNDDQLAVALVDRLNISFQVTKSISRNFDDFFGVGEASGLMDPVILNDSILSVECRHCLVHNRGIVDDELLSAINGRTPRTLLNEIGLGDRLSFDEIQIKSAAESLAAFIEAYVIALEEKLL